MLAVMDSALTLSNHGFRSYFDPAQTCDAGRNSAASPAGREGLIAAAQGTARLYQKMASDPGRKSPDDPFAGSTSITYSSMRHAGNADHAHLSEAQSPSCHDPTQSVDRLLPSGPSVEIMGTELYDEDFM